MRLINLAPAWIERDGSRIGIVFFCPHCVAQGSAHPVPVSCFSIPSPPVMGWPIETAGQVAIFEELIRSVPHLADYQSEEFVPCRKGIAWRFAGDTFDTLTITPSLDASAAGHWHGFITAGEAR